MNRLKNLTETKQTIRKAIPSDAAQIASLLGELGYPATETFVCDRLAYLAPRTEDSVFVADFHGEIAGFLSFHILPLFHVEGGLGRITALAVSSRFQRRGIGKELVSAAESFAWSNGCIRIEVTSGDHRPDAHAFYEAVGYRIDIRRFIKSRQ